MLSLELTSDAAIDDNLQQNTVWVRIFMQGPKTEKKWLCVITAPS